jgi:hypothetical protein
MKKKWVAGFLSLIFLSIAVSSVLAIPPASAQLNRHTNNQLHRLSTSQTVNFTLAASPSNINIPLPFEGYILLSLVNINVTNYVNITDDGDVAMYDWEHYEVQLSWMWVGNPPAYGVFPIGPFPNWVQFSHYGESEYSKLFILVLKSVPDGNYTLRITGKSYQFGSSYVDINLTIHH